MLGRWDGSHAALASEIEFHGPLALWPSLVTELKERERPARHASCIARWRREHHGAFRQPREGPLGEAEQRVEVVFLQTGGPRWAARAKYGEMVGGGQRRARQTRARGVGPAGRRATVESCKRPESEQLSKRCRANERRAVAFPRHVGMQAAAAEHQTWRRRFLQRA
jgi:hypothetical protein